MSFRIVDILKKSPDKNDKQTIASPHWSDSQLLEDLKAQETQQYMPNLFMYHCECIEKFNKWQEYGKNCQSTRTYSQNGFYSNICPKQQRPVEVNRSSLFHPINIFSLPHGHYSKRKGGQIRFTTNQTDVLEDRFSRQKYLSPADRKALAEYLKITDTQVKTWFQNRRAKWRRSKSSPINKSSCEGLEKCTEINVCDSTQ